MSGPTLSDRCFLFAGGLALICATHAPAIADDPPATQPAPLPTTGRQDPADSKAPPPTPVPADSPARLLPADQPYPPLVKEGELRKPIVWEGKRFSTADWIITGAATAVTIGSTIIAPRSTHWKGGRLFDESARDALRLDSQADRFTARDASDVILSLEATWPFFVDAIVGVWWYHGSADAAAEMALIDGKALAIVTALHEATTVFASRERPYGRDCGTAMLPDQVNDCDGSTRYRSFFSGHAATTFMSASLICVHHMKLGIFGSKTADALSCVVAYSGAAATALLRTLADVHYTTDILVGAAVGTAVGLGIPLLHYRKSGSRERRAVGWADGIDMTLLPFGAGLAIGGTF